MKKRLKNIFVIFLSLVMIVFIVSACSASTKETPSVDFSVSYDGVETNLIEANASVHDPSIIEADGRYYIFGSHMTAAYSDDMRYWTEIGNGYTDTNAVYTDLLNIDSGEFDYTGASFSLIPTDDDGYHIWAPDVIYNKAQDLYFMYYCVSSTFNASTICYATAQNVEGPYTWQGSLIYSGLTSKTIDSTDVLSYVSEEYAMSNYVTEEDEYNFSDWPNAIDPSVFYDEDGRMWMVYGTWTGGIFHLESDEESGEVIHPESDSKNDVDAYYGKRLIGGGHKSIEGPYIIYDSGYYYLFVSYGSLEREGGYQIRVFRSDSVDGDYVDMNGKSPNAKSKDHAYYGLKLSGNYYLPSLSVAYMATGGNSAMIGSDGKSYICYHTRFDNGTEGHEPRVKQYFINEEGWPCLLPYATSGETISENGYSSDDVVGTYYMINQGTDISSDISSPIMIELTEGGNVFGDDIKGTWSMEDGTYYTHIKIGRVEYSGVFCGMLDESGADVMTFSAVGDNSSIWGVMYK